MLTQIPSWRWITCLKSQSDLPDLYPNGFALSVTVIAEWGVKQNYAKSLSHRENTSYHVWISSTSCYILKFTSIYPIPFFLHQLWKNGCLSIPVSNQTLPSTLGNLCVRQSFLFLFCSTCLDFWNSLKDTVSTPPFILLLKKLTFTFTSSSKCLSQPGLQERTRPYRIGFERLLFFFF